ncbi:MAG: hypothetical protein QM715_01035 [Nibricoccus sp.]
MKIAPTKKYAVITGDIVDSSKLPKAQRRQLPELIAKASRDTRGLFGDIVPMDVDVFRGDGWQLLVSDPTASLRVGLFFRACLRTAAERGRGLDTRLAIAVGMVDFVRDRVSEGDGEAYRLSGRLLEQIPGKQRLQLALPGEAGDDAMAVIVRLMDVIVQGWTGRQARAICGALRGWTQEKIAGAWPGKVSQQAVTKHLDAANWPALEEALILVEARLGKL